MEGEAKEKIPSWKIYNNRLGEAIKTHSKVSLGFLSARFPVTCNLFIPGCFMLFGVWKALSPEFEVFRTRMFYFSVASVCLTRFYFLRKFQPVFYNYTSKLMVANAIVFGYLSIRRTTLKPRAGITEEERTRLERYSTFQRIAEHDREVRSHLPRGLHYGNYQDFIEKKKAIPSDYVSRKERARLAEERLARESQSVEEINTSTPPSSS